MLCIFWNVFVCWKKLALTDLGVIYLEKENCTRQANGKKDKQDDAGLLEADMLDPWWAGALQMNRLRDLCARPTRRCSAILHPS